MITEEQLTWWERGALEAREIGIDIRHLDGTWYAPIPNTGTEYSLGTIDFANDARDAVPALIAEVRRLRAILRELASIVAGRAATDDHVRRVNDHTAIYPQVGVRFSAVRDAPCSTSPMGSRPQAIPQTHTDAPQDPHLRSPPPPSSE